MIKIKNKITDSRRKVYFVAIWKQIIVRVKERAEVGDSFRCQIATVISGCLCKSLEFTEVLCLQSETHGPERGSGSSLFAASAEIERGLPEERVTVETTAISGSSSLAGPLRVHSSWRRVRLTCPVRIGQHRAHQQVAQRGRAEHARVVDDGEVRTHSFIPYLECLGLLSASRAAARNPLICGGQERVECGRERGVGVLLSVADGYRPKNRLTGRVNTAPKPCEW